MVIQPITSDNYPALIPLYQKLERYYFGDSGVHEPELIDSFIRNKMPSVHSGVSVIGAFRADQVLGFATYSLLYPAPQLKGRLYMKDLFVSEHARGHRIGRQLIAHLAAELIEAKRYSRLSGDALNDFAQPPLKQPVKSPSNVTPHQ